MSDEILKSSFDARAATWDDNPRRVKLAAAVVSAIMSKVALSKDMDCLDFGCGTGLLTLALHPHVRSMTCADSSRGMLDVLSGKVAAAGLEGVSLHYIDPRDEKLPAGPFHLIVSSMTFHHVEHPAAALAALNACCAPGGLLCLADLEPDGGLFHGEGQSAFHEGFSPERVRELFTGAGFAVRSLERVTAMTKQAADGSGPRDFAVFLAVGVKE